MKITKFGHCCLLIEENGVRILTDPGAFSTMQNEIKNIDLVLITHEHPDHLHMESLNIILKNNPDAFVITNSAVGRILEENKELLLEKDIEFEILEHGHQKDFKNISIEGFGEKHAIIYPDYGQVQNTGYFIANKLFYPGDAFTNPEKPVDILALPAEAPWMKVSEAIDYAKNLKPRICFPVHDAILSSVAGFYYGLYETLLKESNIKFVNLEINKETEI